MDIQLSEENKASKIAAVFENEQQTLDAQQTLLNSGNFNQQNIEIVHPKDSHVSEKMEPESKAIAKFITRSHFTIGGIGLLLGLVIATALVISGPDMTRSSPLQTYLAFSIMGTFFGLLIAGLLSLRPDHDPLINQTISATQHHQWSLIIQTEDHDKLKKAYEILEPIAVSVSETL